VATGPELPEELADVPVDLRVDARAFAAGWRKHCGGFARKDPCEAKIDIDGDGKAEKVVRVRERRGSRDGIGVVWADGSVSVLGAGAVVRTLMTDIHMDGVDESWGAFEESMTGLFACRRIARNGDGFGGGPKRDPFPAISPTGDGIMLDGGDAAEIVYWDGKQWRQLILGF
jgi:hypothetical protein